MNLFDPSRNRVNNSPALTTHRTVVPRLNLFPAESETGVRISAMIPAGPNIAREVGRTVAVSDLPKIILNYREDPENTLETLFGISLIMSEPSDAELARGIRRGRTEPRPKPDQAQSLSSAIAEIEL